MSEVYGLVLAAGLGTRLRPVTSYVPKPLLPVAGVTLLDRAIEALQVAGAERIVVNAHHRAHRIAAHLRERVDRDRFHLSIEREILGTGGVFDGARDVLAEADHLLVYNGDVLSDLPLAALLTSHRQSGAVATLAVVDRPEINTVVVGGDGCVRDLADRMRPDPLPDDRALTFTGIACYSRGFLDQVPPGPGHLVDVLVALLSHDPHAVRTFVHQGDWDDLGTLSRYLDVHRRLLGPGYVSLGKDARVPASAVLDECVVLPRTRVPEGTSLHRAVLGPGWVAPAVAVDESALALARTAGFGDSAAIEWITGHGSDRRFARLRDGDRRAVLMTVPADDPDLDRYVAIAGFLYDHGLGAPALLAYDPATRAVLLEDLGRDTLECLIQAQPHRATDLYGRVLDRLADLQTFGTGARLRCPAAWDRTFDRAHLRWETAYFAERFLTGLAGIDSQRLTTLEAEFAALATACLEQPQSLVHRDFQSQNILLKDDVVRLVDVQGMRWGPVAYDAVSLVHDPYIDLDYALRETLLASFPDRLESRGGQRLADSGWQAMCVTAGLQRLMQALGAFAFLSAVKKREQFRQHIPAALNSLRRLVAQADTLAGRPYAPPPLPHLAATLTEIAPRFPLANPPAS